MILTTLIGRAWWAGFDETNPANIDDAQVDVTGANWTIDNPTNLDEYDDTDSEVDLARFNETLDDPTNTDSAELDELDLMELTLPTLMEQMSMQLDLMKLYIILLTMMVQTLMQLELMKL